MTAPYFERKLEIVDGHQKNIRTLYKVPFNRMTCRATRLKHIQTENWLIKVDQGKFTKSALHEDNTEQVGYRYSSKYMATFNGHVDLHEAA